MDIKEERANFEAGQEAKEVEERDEEVNEPAPSLVSYIPSLAFLICVPRTAPASLRVLSANASDSCS